MTTPPEPAESRRKRTPAICLPLTAASLPFTMSALASDGQPWGAFAIGIGCTLSFSALAIWVISRRAPAIVMTTKLETFEVIIPTLDGDGITDRAEVVIPVAWDDRVSEWVLTPEAHQIIDNTKARYAQGEPRSAP